MNWNGHEAFHDSQKNPYPIRLSFNYWEFSPAGVAGQLDDFVRAGVKHLTSFVPWQNFESDITHSLSKYLQGAAEREIRVTLILTPEVGVHAPLSGLPRQLLSKPDVLAVDHRGRDIVCFLPPKAFSVPTHFSQEFTRALTGFLTRFHVFLADLSRASRKAVGNLDVFLSGSFWKYIGISDSSKTAGLAFRKALDDRFKNAEYRVESQLLLPRLRSDLYDVSNRKWFFDRAERLYREHTLKLLQKNEHGLRIQEVEIHMPDAEPSIQSSQLLRFIAGGSADFFQISRMLEVEASTESGFPPFLHWSAMGGFRSLSDPERQYLILKSLMLFGARGGGLLMDTNLWTGLSPSFRSRVEILSRAVASGKIRQPAHAAFFTPNVWAVDRRPGSVYESLLRLGGPTVRAVSRLEAVERDSDLRLVVVDPAHILTTEEMSRLISWTASGGVLCIADKMAMTGPARAAFDTALEEHVHDMDVQQGIPFRSMRLRDGQMVVYAAPPSDPKSMDAFLSAVLGVGDVKPVCEVSDDRLKVFPIRVATPSGERPGLMVLNGSGRPVSADLIFREPVWIADLSTALREEIDALKLAQADTEPGLRFSLDLPPCGVVTLAVAGLSTAVEDRLAAARLNARGLSTNLDLTRDFAAEAAASQLPGFNSEVGQ